MPRLFAWTVILSSFAVPAMACPSGQYEQCLGIICGCVPDWLPDPTTPPSLTEIPGLKDLPGAAEVDQSLRQAAKNADEFVDGLTDEGKEAIDQALKAGDRAVSDTARNLVKGANDIVDAAEAIGRFAERQVNSIPEVYSDAERRIREGKVGDAIWHIGTDNLQNTNKSAAQLAQESQLVAQAAQLAAATYGGPAGAAAFAAWQAYNQSGGDIELSIKAGAYAYALSAGYGDIEALPSGSAGEIAKKAAVTGAVAGLSVAASGGSTEAVIDAFIESGGAVVVQAGQAYVTKEYAEPALAEADVYCTEIAMGTCNEVDEWYAQAQEYVAEAPEIASGGANVRFTANGEWAISWNRSAIQNPESKVPAVTLTYVGEGSPYLEKFREIAALANPAISAHDLVPAHYSRGWIFLGRYLSGSWILPRSDDLNGNSPEEITGQEITLSMPVNLRSAAFEVVSTDTGCDTTHEPPIIGGLRLGTPARIVRVVRLDGCRSYVWAEVEH